jgi:hypothetical protein
MNGLNSQDTKRAYAVHLSLFCRFHQINPDDLVRLNPSELKNMVTRYVLELKNKSKNTAINETRWYKNCMSGCEEAGGRLQFDMWNYQTCGNNANGDKAYYDGFVQGCDGIQEVKYTKDLCESFVTECLSAHGPEADRNNSECTASSLGQAWHKILDNQKTTVIQSASATTTTASAADVSNCKLDGSADGIQQKFDAAKYQACKLHTNNDRIYYDSFVTGCMQIGNTKLICETVADSSILNLRTQSAQAPETQSTQAVQPTAINCQISAFTTCLDC